jgi:hypothetical protein
LLAPPERPGTDTTALRAEARKLRQRKTELPTMFADGVIDAADMASGARQIKWRLETAEQQLAAATEPDMLAGFRDPLIDAATAWESMSLGRRREIARALVKVTFVPARPVGGRINPDSARVEWLAPPETAGQHLSADRRPPAGITLHEQHEDLAAGQGEAGKPRRGACPGGGD